jgi:hypothetical protein
MRQAIKETIVASGMFAAFVCIVYTIVVLLFGKP